MAYTYNYQYTPGGRGEVDDAMRRYMDTRERMLGAYTSGQRATRLTAEAEADRLAAEQYAADTNVQASALKGASIGAVGGPWGALGGAILGAGVGTRGAYEARKKKGQSKWEAGWNTFKDISNPLTIGKQLLGATQQNPGAAASVAGTVGRAASKSSTARGPATTAKPTAGSQAVQDYYDRLQQLDTYSQGPQSTSGGTTSLQAPISYGQYQGDLAATQQAGPMTWDDATKTWRYRGT